jgi:PAS domain S-box-containing protein
MATDLRKTGISVVGDMPWGTHFCSFYKTKQDLLDIIAPFFKAGLESKEFCLWVISLSVQLTVEEARSALRQALPGFDRYLAEGSIEMVSPYESLLKEATFDLHQFFNRLDEKLGEALSRDYAGMRVSGSPAWLQRKDPCQFLELERSQEKFTANQRLLVTCTFPLEVIGVDELLEAARAHQFAITRRNGHWEVFGNPELKQTKEELKRLNEELEQRVAERTRDLAAANEALRWEIKERERVEAALKEGQQQYESLVQSIDAIIVEHDGQASRVTFVNKPAERILGYPLEQWLDEPNFWADHLHPDDRDWAVKAKAQAVAKREDHTMEFRMIAADGRVVWLRDIVTVSATGDNSVRLRAVMVDITDLKILENEVLAREEWLNAFFTATPAGLVMVDDELRFVRINETMARINGLPVADHLGKTVREALPGIASIIEPILRKVLDTGEPELKLELTGENPLKPGVMQHLAASYFPLHDRAGKASGVGALIVDQTERKRAEEQLKRLNEKLRALSARLQSVREEESHRIAREIHDELGNTLTGLNMDLSYLGKKLSKSGNASAHEKIKSMSELIKETIHKVQNISTELRPSALDHLGLAAAIEWEASEFQRRTQIESNIVSLEEEVALNEEQSTAVFRIFQEALTNILRHAQATRVDVAMGKEDGELVLTISDNGRGITEDEKSGQCTLGILGMQERAHLVGGEIEITGAEGKGTVVTVRVPTSG